MLKIVDYLLHGRHALSRRLAEVAINTTFLFSFQIFHNFLSDLLLIFVFHLLLYLKIHLQEILLASMFNPLTVLIDVFLTSLELRK